MYLDPQDVADEKFRRAVAERSQAIKARHRDEDLRQAMTTEWGRRLLWELARGVQANPLTIADTTNAHETFLRLGRAAESWALLQRVLVVAPEQYLVAARESQAHDTACLDAARNELVRGAK